MSIKSRFIGRCLFSGSLLLLLSACNSSYLSVKKSELSALDQCQQGQQSLQLLLSQQQTRLDESLALLQEGLDMQKRQTDLPPPVAVEQPARDCPKPAPAKILPPSNAEALFQDKQLVGERERVLLNAIDVVLRARINTGFYTSQLDARNIQMFERDGQEWVRFTVIDRQTETPHELERKRLRYVQTNGDDESSRRPIVEIRITIGKVTQNSEFVLVDRGDQTYPLLIGRNVLRDVMLVDVSRSDLAPVVREAPAPAQEPAQERAQP